VTKEERWTMRQILQLTLMLCLAAMAGGCFPESLIVWNGDGSRALVLAAEKTYVTDADGSLSEFLDGHVSAAAWLGDGNRVLLAERREVGRWNDLEPLLDKERVGQIKIVSAMLRAAAMEAETLEEAGKMSEKMPADLLAPAVLHLRDHADQELRRKLGQQWDELEDVKVTVNVLTVRAATTDGDSKPVRIAVVLGDVRGLKVSPDGKHAIFVSPSAGSPHGALWAVTLQEGSEPIEVAKSSGPADWCADGLDVIYATGESFLLDERLTAITRRQVVGKNGDLGAFIASRSHATAVTHNHSLLRCMPDGRVVFSSRLADLPAPDDVLDWDRRWGLFALDSEGKLTRLWSSDEASVDDAFALSPDGRRFAVSAVGAGVGITVVELSSGKSWVAVEAGDIISLPAWRTPTSLSVVLPAGVKDGHPDKPTVALMDVETRKVRAISTDWPDTVLEGLLKRAPRTEAPTTTAPATQPAGSQPGS
jgi:hypothetical protein